MRRALVAVFIHGSDPRTLPDNNLIEGTIKLYKLNGGPIKR